MVAFAPATSMKYFNNKILRVVSHHLEELSVGKHKSWISINKHYAYNKITYSQLIADFLYSKELLPSEDVRRFLSQYFCRSHNIVCQDFIEQIAGSSKHSNYVGYNISTET